MNYLLSQFHSNTPFNYSLDYIAGGAIPLPAL
nr:MAG TPA: hypothetical protein [Caudoviricetes sp.]